MGAAENTTKDSRCERQGKKAEGNKEGGARFEEDGIQSDFFYDTHLPQECSINMVISPAGNRKCWRLEVIFCTCCHESGWAGWRSPVEWLGVLLRGSRGNGSQASLKSHFLLTKRVEVVCKWQRGLKSAKHIHAHIANHRWKIRLEEPEILYQLLNILLLIVKKTLMAQTQSDIT